MSGGGHNFQPIPPAFGGSLENHSIISVTPISCALNRNAHCSVLVIKLILRGRPRVTSRMQAHAENSWSRQVVLPLVVQHYPTDHHHPSHQHHDVYELAAAPRPVRAMPSKVAHGSVLVGIFLDRRHGPPQDFHHCRHPAAPHYVQPTIASLSALRHWIDSAWRYASNATPLRPPIDRNASSAESRRDVAGPTRPRRRAARSEILPRSLAS